MTMTPKGPIIIGIILISPCSFLLLIEFLVSGPFGVMVIRGRGTPLLDDAAQL